uniref:Brf1 TBP-binding domain-containing protein n=1 Tax=Oryzias latipes TaxID=8090 RepID=A0A3B3H889_ORYLA
MKQNAEYLQEQKEKEERINKEKEQGIYKEKQKKKYRKREQIEASTAEEAIEKMLEKKKISSKINYDVLRDLNTGAGSPTKTSESMQPWFKQDQRKLQLLQASSPQLCFNLSQSIQVEPAVTIATHSTEPPDSVPDAGFTPSAALPPAEEDEEEEEEEEVEKECVSALQLVGGQSRTGSHHQTIWTVTDCFFVIGRLWL